MSSGIEIQWGIMLVNVCRVVKNVSWLVRIYARDCSDPALVRIFHTSHQFYRVSGTSSFVVQLLVTLVANKDQIGSAVKQLAGNSFIPSGPVLTKRVDVGLLPDVDLFLGHRRLH